MKQQYSGTAAKMSGTTIVTRFIFLILITLLFITTLTATSSALELSIDAPSSVKIDERFLVKIDADSEETFDVKIFVHNSQDEKITRGDYISDIYYEGWQSSWNYAEEAFPESKEFKLMVLESPGKREICLRLRKSSSGTTYLECDEIKILDSTKKDDSENKTVWTNNPQVEELQSEIQEPPMGEGRITLNSETEEQRPIEIATKRADFRTGIIYSFTLLTAIVAILLALRRL